MIYRDLREWIEAIEQEGELNRIKEEINLEPDVGAIAVANINLGARGILAERIAGFNTMLSIGLHHSDKRISMAFGLPKEAGMEEKKAAWKKAYDKYPIKAKMVSKRDAPCKENIVRGDEVNLFQFPIPRLNEQDAGPYFLKTHCITKDFDSDWVNIGMYRVQVLDRNRTSIFCSHTSHLGEHFIKARQLGRPLEMAIALGTDPVLPLVAGTRIPYGWDEFDFAGALRGEPIEVVKAESVDLPVPATAEIVIEGVLRHDVEVLEGPFGEFTAAYSGFYVMPVFEVKTITYRNNPIHDTVYLGIGRSEGSYITIVPRMATMELELKRMCPSITQVACLTPHLENYVIQGRWANKTEPRHAILALFASESAVQAKMVTIVDEDVDPWDADRVMWAISARCQANTDVVIIPGSHCRLDPSVEVDGTTCLFGIDATKSMEPHPRHSISEWVTARRETKAWEEKLAKLREGGKS